MDGKTGVFYSTSKYAFVLEKDSCRAPKPTPLEDESLFLAMARAKLLPN